MTLFFQQSYGQQNYGSYAQPAAADGSYTQTTPAAGGYPQQQQQYGSSYGQPASGQFLKKELFTNFNLFGSQKQVRGKICMNIFWLTCCPHFEFEQNKVHFIKHRSGTICRIVCVDIQICGPHLFFLIELIKDKQPKRNSHSL